MKILPIFFTLFLSFQVFAQSLNIPLVTVHGNATVYVKPNEVHFSIVIEKFGEQISNARQSNRDIAEKVFQFLKKQGIEEKYIQSQYMSIRPNYIHQRRNNRGNWPDKDGFIARQNVYVCLSDISKYDEIADGLLLMDIESFNGPNFKSTELEKAKMEANKKAMLDAKQKAIALAGELGQKIGPAKLISDVSKDNSRGFNAYSGGAKASTGAAETSSSFAIGQLEISVAVSVSFELLSE